MSEQVENNDMQTGNAEGFVLLNNIKKCLQKYFVLTEAQAVTITLWIIHTYTFLSAEVTPYIHLTSAEKESGKTVLLELLAMLVHNPWFTDNPTTAAFARKIEQGQPTLLLDEVDTIFKYGNRTTETLRGMLNAGYRRSGKISLCAGDRANIEVKDYSVFCPKAIAGLGQIPDTVASRSISIVLKRKCRQEVVARFRLRYVQPEAQSLKEAIEAWVPTVQLPETEPDILEELSDRAADSWDSLLQIADFVGNGWSQMARNAALELSSPVARDDQSIGIRLLTDIKSIFDARGADRISTADLVHALKRMEEFPWAELNHMGITPVRMAKILKPYGISPGTIRIDETTIKGYYREQFIDAWRRYVATIETPQR